MVDENFILIGREFNSISQLDIGNTMYIFRVVKFEKTSTFILVWVLHISGCLVLRLALNSLWNRKAINQFVSDVQLCSTMWVNKGDHWSISGIHSGQHWLKTTGKWQASRTYVPFMPNQMYTLSNISLVDSQKCLHLLQFHPAGGVL